MQLTHGTIHLNIPHNLTHSGSQKQYITVEYDIIGGDLEVYILRVPFEVLADVKDYRALKTHCERMVRYTVHVDPFEPTQEQIDAAAGYVEAGMPF